MEKDVDPAIAGAPYDKQQKLYNTLIRIWQHRYQKVKNKQNDS